MPATVATHSIAACDLEAGRGAGRWDVAARSWLLAAGEALAQELRERA
ncbi:MAG TPA: hypothetical protein VFB42_08855 [Gaiellaceae bacterium]|nr:hypothetical protein [Gaiellaceae bacterium]